MASFFQRRATWNLSLPVTSLQEKVSASHLCVHFSHLPWEPPPPPSSPALPHTLSLTFPSILASPTHSFSPRSPYLWKKISDHSVVPCQPPAPWWLSSAAVSNSVILSGFLYKHILLELEPLLPSQSFHPLWYLFVLKPNAELSLLTAVCGRPKRHSEVRQLYNQMLWESSLPPSTLNPLKSGPVFWRTQDSNRQQLWAIHSPARVFPAPDSLPLSLCTFHSLSFPLWVVPMFLQRSSSTALKVMGWNNS